MATAEAHEVPLKCRHDGSWPRCYPRVDRPARLPLHIEHDLGWVIALFWVVDAGRWAGRRYPGKAGRLPVRKCLARKHPSFLEPSLLLGLVSEAGRSVEKIDECARHEPTKPGLVPRYQRYPVLRKAGARWREGGTAR